MWLKVKQTAVNVTQTGTNMNKAGESSESFCGSRKNRIFVKHFKAIWGRLSPWYFILNPPFVYKW